MKHKLAGIIGDRHRQIVHAVVDEIMAPAGEQVAFKLMPLRNVPAAYLIHERISGHGGMTGERQLGEKGKAVSAGSGETRLFQPGAYQEFIQFNERDLLLLRKFGSIGERGVTGLTGGELDHMSRGGNKLKVRMSNRMQKLIWDAIFNGTYVWKGVTFSFGIPGGNTIAASTDWSNASAGKPLSDLWALQATNAKLLKYKVKEWIINPKTNADAMATNEVRDVLKNYNVRQGDLNTVAALLYPGLAPIRVVADVWQDESLSSEGAIVLGDASFFVPNDKVLMIPDLGGSMYPEFGEFDLTENLNDPSATLESPAVGPYTFVDEKGLEDRMSPHVKIVGGFNGAPNLLRSDDIFVITC